MENTLPAFEHALREGADGVELDVHASTDGVAYVFHDATLERLTPGADPRALGALSSAEIDAVRLTNGASIPRLSAVLDLLAEAMEVNIEIKDRAAVEGCADALRGRHLDSVVFSSFSGSALRTARALLPKIPRALITGEYSRDPKVWLESVWPIWHLRRCGALRWHPNHRLVHGALVKALHRRGVGVHVWTVDTPALAMKLAEDGVDAILTDRPGWMKTALARRKDATP